VVLLVARVLAVKLKKVTRIAKGFIFPDKKISTR
jgi:hypothetical protein